MNPLILLIIPLGAFIVHTPPKPTTQNLQASNAILQPAVMPPQAYVSLQGSVIPLQPAADLQ